MRSIFSRIILGELPAQLVWQDDVAVAFLDLHPRTVGHTLVVPRREVDQWTDLADDESERLFWVARQIAKAQIAEFDCTRAGLVIAGYHVPHVHLHVFPTTGLADFDFRGMPPEAHVGELRHTADRLREALRRNGFTSRVPVRP